MDDPRVNINKLANITSTITITADTLNKIDKQIDLICVVASLGVQLKVCSDELAEMAIKIKSESDIG